MSWRDLKPIHDDWYEMERPSMSETGWTDGGGKVTLTFRDDVSREWFAEWLRSKRGWQAFTAWVDEKR